MNLKKLTLRSFRSYEKAKLLFSSRINYLCGPNASGKTNLLEAIGVLSLGKSFRGGQDRDMLQTDSEAYLISCDYEKQGHLHNLSYGYQAYQGYQSTDEKIQKQIPKKNQRKIKKDAKILSGRQALIGNIVCVLFTPADIAIVEGGPMHRRRFLDTVLSYQSKEYFQNLILFHQALQQRNAMLKDLKRKSIPYTRKEDLEIWNESLVKYANSVTEARLLFVQNFKRVFQEALLEISQGKDKLTMSLFPSHEQEFSNYTKLLKDSYIRDLSMGYTSFGPHRQNLAFQISGQDVTHKLSQGQKRSLVLSLRLAQFFFLKDALEFSPILLIDDVLCELDEVRRKAFVKVLENCEQAIITHPSVEEIHKQLIGLVDEVYVYKIPAAGYEPILVKNSMYAIS